MPIKTTKHYSVEVIIGCERHGTTTTGFKRRKTNINKYRYFQAYITNIS